MQMTRRTAARLLVLALAALPLTGCSYNRFVTPGRGDQGAVGAGAEPAAAPQRSDSRTWSRRSRATRSTKKACSRRSPTRDRGCWPRRSPEETIQAANQQTSALGRLLADRRELSAAQGERAVQPADGRALRHREPHRDRADALQRAHSGVQHVAAAVPGEPDGEDVRLQGVSVLRGAARSQAGAEGELHAALRVRVPWKSRCPGNACSGAAAPPGRPGARYALTDFRLVRVDGRALGGDRRSTTSATFAATRSWIDRLLGTSTVDRPRPRRHGSHRSCFVTSDAARSSRRCSSCSPAIRTRHARSRTALARRSRGNRAVSPSRAQRRWRRRRRGA